MEQAIRLTEDEVASLAAIQLWAQNLPRTALDPMVVEVRGPDGLVVQVDRGSGNLHYVRADPPEIPF